MRCVFIIKPECLAHVCQHTFVFFSLAFAINKLKQNCIGCYCIKLLRSRLSFYALACVYNNVRTLYAIKLKISMDCPTCLKLNFNYLQYASTRLKCKPFVQTIIQVPIQYNIRIYKYCHFQGYIHENYEQNVYCYCIFGSFSNRVWFFFFFF